MLNCKRNYHSICLDEPIKSPEDARKATSSVPVKSLSKMEELWHTSKMRKICRENGIPVGAAACSNQESDAHNIAVSTLQGYDAGDVSASRDTGMKISLSRQWKFPAQDDSAEKPGIGFEIKRDLIEKLTVKITNLKFYYCFLEDAFAFK